MGVLSHSCEYVPDIFFLSVILFFGTFFTCTFIKSFKFTPFFPTKASQLPSNTLSECLLRSVASLLTMLWSLPSSSLSHLTTPSTLQRPSLLSPQSWRYKHSHQSILHAPFPANSVRPARLVDTHDRPIFPLVPYLLAWSPSHLSPSCLICPPQEPTSPSYFFLTWSQPHLSHRPLWPPYLGTSTSWPAYLPSSSPFSSSWTSKSPLSLWTGRNTSWRLVLHGIIWIYFLITSWKEPVQWINWIKHFLFIPTPQKGAGYHLDMLVVGLMMGVCSLFGLPWCVAATVLCLGHVDRWLKFIF